MTERVMEYGNGCNKYYIEYCEGCGEPVGEAVHITADGSYCETCFIKRRRYFYDKLSQLAVNLEEIDKDALMEALEDFEEDYL